MTAKEFEAAIEKALRQYAVSATNPCGGTGYVDAGEAKPYRVLYADGCECDRFDRIESAIQAASDYADEMDAENP